mgnify:CR=1 FL=1
MSKGFSMKQSQPAAIAVTTGRENAPVCAEVGPDGAVWICDWYNLIVQHNPTPTRGSASR